MSSTGSHPLATKMASGVGRRPIGAHRTQTTSTLDLGPPDSSPPCPRTREAVGITAGHRLITSRILQTHDFRTSQFCFFMVTINRSSLKPITRLGERQCPTVGEDDGLACSIRSKRTSKHHRDLSITTYREHVPLLLFTVQGKHPRNGWRTRPLRTLPENLQCHYQQGEPTVLHSA